MNEKLIEKVYEIHCHWFNGSCDANWQPLYGGVGFGHDVILALKPIIAKHERERLIKQLEQWRDSGAHLISFEAIQALKVGK